MNEQMRVVVPFSLQCMDCGCVLLAQFSREEGNVYTHEARYGETRGTCPNEGKRYRIAETLVKVEEIPSPTVGLEVKS